MFIFCGKEADKDGFVPGIQIGSLVVSGGGTRACGTAAAEGGRWRPSQMNAVPEDDDDRPAADGIRRSDSHSQGLWFPNTPPV